MEYRGIKLVENIRLYKKDGTFNKVVKNAIDTFVDLLMEKGHELLSEYARIDEKVLIDFNCGHKPHPITPANYKTGYGCPKCGTNDGSIKQSEQAKLAFVLLVESNGHELLSEYISTHKKVLINFKCGHSPHQTTPARYKIGQKCPKCVGLCPEQAEEDLIELLKQNGHEMLSEYLDSKKKVLIDFKCGHDAHWIKPNNYKKGSGCPVCNESKGEKKIREWLEINDFEYEPQKEYDGLLGMNNGKLSYDFYLQKQNILIEYQGEFHDGVVKNQTKKHLAYQQEHDRRKKEYAEINNITLLEIWHWDFNNIEEILQNKLIQNR